ncbi:MAG: DinB family protein, partial [Bacteriovoracaceae bacterium]
MSDLLQIYNSARKSSLNLCKPLSIDDYNVQPKDEVSPPKWHLAHTTWFFETFILKSFYNNYKVFHPKFDYIFNSYYKGHGEHWKQSRRSLLSRPTVDDVYRYRAYVDRHIAELLETKRPVALELAHLFEVGLNHEEQHQELLIMDIKSIFGSQALKPQYARANHVSGASLGAYKWIDYDVHKLVTIGARPEGFSYDNERPQFSHYLASFSLSDRFITNAEYKDFILAGGYEHSEFWLSQGWDWRQNNSVKNPLYWSRNLEKEFTLLGEISLEPSAPVA